jgi:hypothetical protein
VPYLEIVLPIIIQIASPNFLYYNTLRNISQKIIKSSNKYLDEEVVAAANKNFDQFHYMILG